MNEPALSRVGKGSGKIQFVFIQTTGFKVKANASAVIREIHPRMWLTNTNKQKIYEHFWGKKILDLLF